MKVLRTFFVLLLCVMLPLSGLAATGMAGKCPMQPSMPVHDHESMSAGMSGCGMMKSSTEGKAKGVFCKAAAQCQFASLYHPPVRPTVMRPLAAGNQVVFHYIASLSVREPGGLWRPPRAI